eukprot:Hpha_TRINITY_DN31459_c0_g1::TRINITY_DN31459_c0_g1_i1::g.145396::m.145396
MRGGPAPGGAARPGAAAPPAAVSFIRQAVRWVVGKAVSVTVSQSVDHYDTFVQGFLFALLFLCLLYGPSGSMGSVVLTLGIWVCLRGGYFYTRKIYLRQWREVRERVIAQHRTKVEPVSTHEGGGAPTLD